MRLIHDENLRVCKDHKNGHFAPTFKNLWPAPKDGPWTCLTFDMKIGLAPRLICEI